MAGIDIESVIANFNRTLGVPQGFATGGAVQTPGIHPPAPINAGGDNTVIAAKTGEYVLPDTVVNAIGKDKLDFLVYTLTGTPPNNAAPPAPGAPPRLGIQPPGFAVGGEVQDPLAGQDVAPMPAPVETAPKAAGIPLPSTAAPAPAIAPAGLSPKATPAPPHNGEVKQAPPAPGAPPPGLKPIKPVPVDDIGTTRDPLAKGFTGTGIVPGQPMNSKVLVDDIISRQGQQDGGAKFQDEVARAVKVNAANGIAPDASQVKTLGLQPGEVNNMLAANNKGGRFDGQIEVGLKNQQLTNEADYNKAALGLKQIGLGIKQQEADTKAENVASLADHRKALEEAKKKIGSGVMSSLDPQTRKDLAAQYAKTGKLPPMGMGAQAAADRAAILGEWSQTMHGSGQTVEDQLSRQAALKASQGELNKLQGQRGTIMAFAKTADSNLELVSQLSAKVDRTGVPLVNKWLIAGKRSIKGDPETAKFDAAVRTAINEYAKVTSSASGGGVTSDSARKEVESMLNSAQTPEQITEVIKLLRQEITNRQKGYDDQIKEVHAAILGHPVEHSETPGIPQGTAPGAQQFWKKPGTNSVPMGAVNMLKQNPTAEMKKHFDEKYGPGYADAVLKG